MNKPHVWNREKLAWAAGFFSGEGCTYIPSTKNQQRVRMCISQCTLPVLEKFKDAVSSFGSITGPYKQKTRNSRQYWSWTLSDFESVQALIAAMWCFLSDEKKEQAKEKLEKQIRWLRTRIIKKKGPSQKINKKQQEFLRTRKESFVVLAKKFKVSSQTISNAINGRGVYAK